VTYHHFSCPFLRPTVDYDITSKPNSESEMLYQVQMWQDYTYDDHTVLVLLLCEVIMHSYKTRKQFAHAQWMISAPACLHVLCTFHVSSPS